MTTTRRAAIRRAAPLVLLLLGVAALGAGAWMIYPPAGFIVVGALSLAGGWLAIPATPVVRYAPQRATPERPRPVHPADAELAARERAAS
jgi:hypothetical protein